METLQKFELQEPDLELVVSKKTLGSLKTNALQIKNLVEKALPNYDIANYNEENIDMAKKDKAMLNKASKILNAKRIELEKEFNKPFQEFKEVITETVKLISDCSSKIDTVVKLSEQKAKDEKQSEIESFWNEQEFKLVPLSKVFDEKWLNKTAKIKDVKSEILEKISKVNDDILTIEAIGSDVDLLKSLYLDTLNLNSTIQYANTLKQNRETAQNEAEQRVQNTAKAEQVAEVQKVETTTDENPFEKVKEVVESAKVEPSKTELLTRTMKVHGTYDQLVALANFMNDKGITFEKIENGTV